MSSASAIFGTKAYVCARYFLRPGKCFKYIDQRGEDATEYVYEVMTLYPYCVLLRDTRNGVRTCPGYNTLSLMPRGMGIKQITECIIKKLTALYFHKVVGSCSAIKTVFMPRM